MWQFSDGVCRKTSSSTSNEVQSSVYIAANKLRLDEIRQGKKFG